MSTNNEFSLDIFVDQSVVFPGEQIGVTLRGHAGKDTKNVRMILKLIGELTASIDMPSQFPESVGQRTEMLLEQEYIIYEGDVSKGDKNREFNLPLPPNLPPSTYYKKNEYGNATAKIQYKIQVITYIDNQHAHNAEHVLNVAPKLSMHQQKNEFLPQHVEKNDVTQPRGFFCCARPMGVEMRGVLSHGFACPGDSLEIDFQATNFSKVDILEIFVSLIQIVDLKVDNVFNSKGKKEILEFSYPGFEENIKEKFKIDIPQQIDLFSFERENFSCKYEVEVKLIISQWQYSTINIPVQIVGALEKD